jgi:sarcosine oxidase subunit gamma
MDRVVTAERRARHTLERRLEAIGATEMRRAQVDVRIDMRQALGSHPLLPPTVPNTWSVERGGEWLWLGPDEWLVLADPDPPEPARLIAELEAALEGTHHSVVDVSAGRTAIELGRADRHDLLARGCGLDLHPRSWRPGTCAQTLLARVPVILQEREAATLLLVRPSFAGYLVAWLLDAAGADVPGG